MMTAIILGIVFIDVVMALTCIGGARNDREDGE